MSGFSDTIVMPMYCWTGIPDTFLVSATTAAATLQQANCNWFRNTCQWNESICTAHHQITYCLQCTSTIRTGMLLTNACKQLQWRSDSGWGPVVCAMRSDWQRQKSGGQTCQVREDVHIKGSSRRNADAFGWKSSTTTCADVSNTDQNASSHISPARLSTVIWLFQEPQHYNMNPAALLYPAEPVSWILLPPPFHNPPTTLGHLQHRRKTEQFRQAYGKQSSWDQNSMLQTQTRDVLVLSCLFLES